MFENEKAKLLSQRSRRIIAGINKEISKRKKLKTFFTVCALLWAAAGAQWIAEKIFQENTRLAEAFVSSNTVLTESMAEVTAFYGSSYLTEQDKMDLVRYLAEKLGISIETEAVNYVEYEDKQAYRYVKTAKQAETTIKVVTLDKAYSKSGMKEHYLLIRIKIAEDINGSISVYQKKIQEILKDLGAEGVGDTLQYSGSFTGKLTISELDRIAGQMINSLSGKTVYANRDENLYTIYAYSGGIDDYVSVDGLKINIQVAASYDETKDRTQIYLATPVISGDW